MGLLDEFDPETKLGDALDVLLSRNDLVGKFLKLLSELNELGMPDRFWPKILRFGAEFHDGLESKVLEIRKQTSKKATDARHLALREFKKKAALAAENEWLNGSKLLHHQMAKYLAEEYEDETGKHPFLFLPEAVNENNTPDNVLKMVCKEVAKKMNRPDLISGQKKSS